MTLMLCRMLSPEADQTASPGRARELKLAPVQNIFLITKQERSFHVTASLSASPKQTVFPTTLDSLLMCISV